LAIGLEIRGEFEKSALVDVATIRGPLTAKTGFESTCAEAWLDAHPAAVITSFDEWAVEHNAAVGRI
jgi:hypothetical protein